MPGEAFGSPGYLRLSYALGDDDLVEGVARMQKLLRLTAQRSTRRCATSARCPRRTCTCTSPGRCGTPRWSSSPSATGSCCPTRWSRTGRRSCRRPTRRAGSASSGSTTSPARCCAPRTTYAGWCARPPRTTSRDGGRWLEIQVDPSGYAARFGGITAFTDLVLDAVARRLARDRASGMAVVVAANRTRHPLDARTLARLAAQYAGRGVVGFGLSNDERRGTHRRLRPGLPRSPSAPGCCWCRTAASCSGPERVRTCLDELHADRLGHGVRVAEDPALLERVVGGGVPLEVCPVSNVSLGVYSDLASVPLPAAARRRRDGRARRRRPAAVRFPAGRPVRHHARRPRPRPTTSSPTWPGCRCAPRGRPTWSSSDARRHRRLAGRRRAETWPCRMSRMNRRRLATRGVEPAARAVSSTATSGRTAALPPPTRRPASHGRRASTSRAVTDAAGVGAARRRSPRFPPTASCRDATAPGPDAAQDVGVAPAGIGQRRRADVLRHRAVPIGDVARRVPARRPR